MLRFRRHDDRWPPRRLRIKPRRRGIPPGSDATVGSDGATPSDANAEAAEARDVSVADVGSASDGGGSYCATIAKPDAGDFFCDDFDNAEGIGVWQNYDELEGTLTVTDASSRSPPNSVNETTMPVAFGQPVNVALRTPEPVVTAPATVIFAFSLEPVQIDITAGAAIVLGAVNFLDNNGNRYTVSLAINVVSGEPALALGEQSGPVNGGNYPDGGPPIFVNHPLAPTDSLPMNAWSDLVIELDWTPTSLDGKVSINGGLKLSASLTMTLVPSSIQIGIGTSYVTEYPDGGLSPVWELRYDNVLFTAN